MDANAFVEKRKLTLKEFLIINLLEDTASHGLTPQIGDYSIELIHLGKRGVFRILCHGKDKLLVGRRYPPRVRKIDYDMWSNYEYTFFF
jgi:hypothetical protein